MSVWNKVMSLNVPSKAKHLLWRMSQDLLPDSTVIQNQLVRPTDKGCLSCDSVDGGYTHTLIRCEYARAVWFGCPLGIIQVHKNPVISLSVLATDLCTELDRDTLAIWAMVAWGIWYNRQSRCQRKLGYDPMELIEKVARELEEFQKRNSYVKSLNKLAFRKVVWLAPPAGWVKINCSLCQYSYNDFGIGCVIRDDMGDVLGSFVHRLTFEEVDEETIILDEERTILEGLMFGLSMGFRTIILEIDDKDMVEKVQSNKWKISKEVEFLKDIRLEDFIFEVFQVSRDDNRLARSVAWIAQEFSKGTVWIDELPLGVNNKDMV
ncbi:reverse transcriptase [Artemisia annua]|uniref:Reverse transcriptase n=1 Tax=Artemisia annua TaxID=35608 RepID=A0A2U1Q8N5_ARTAN|nr:reverse transcriptase [Artemisia annua]